jgi:hypothetical protein
MRSIVALFSGTIVVAMIVGGAAYAQNTDELAQQLRQLVHAGNTSKITDTMARQGAPREVGARYFSAAENLYQTRDLEATIAVSQKGIEYCLAQAGEAVKRNDTALATELRGQAKALSYNLGSYTWPGWDESGIDIKSQDQAIGFDAALQNLKLGEELSRGPEPMARAHWLVGAHALAAGKHPLAIQHFEKSAELAHAAANQAEELLAQAFRAMTIIAVGTSRTEGEIELARVKDAYVENVADGQFWINQLETAYRVFIAK